MRVFAIAICVLSVSGANVAADKGKKKSPATFELRLTPKTGKAMIVTGDARGRKASGETKVVAVGKCKRGGKDIPGVVAETTGKLPEVEAQLKTWQKAGEKIKVSVIARDRDGTEATRWDMFDCFPTRWDPGEYSPSSNVASETIVTKMQRVKLAVGR